ncbi:MAG: helix-turn-helix domain-containing protein [Thermomicrobiales bacterium]|jgi:DNA-binding CsgD family transcriptional regulator
MIEEAHLDQHTVALTRRQRQVLRMQAYGLTHQEIAEHLGLSIWTVKNHHKQAVKTLALSLRTIPRERVRTSLACYILGLLDGGWSPRQVALHLKDVSPPVRKSDESHLGNFDAADDELAPAAS